MYEFFILKKKTKKSIKKLDISLNFVYTIVV